MFAKLECDNVLQPEPQGLAKVNMGKNVILSLLYTFFSSTQGLNDNEVLCLYVLMGMKPTASDWSTISCIVAL